VYSSWWRLAIALFFNAGVIYSSAAQQIVSSEDKDAPTHEINLLQQEQFKLLGDYYKGRKKADGFLLLHDCSADRTAYQSITEQLAQANYHVLSLDLRGFGRSVSPKFSHDKIKRQTKDIVLYQQKLAQLTSYWEDDVMVAYNFLRQKLDNVSRISILSSGCSAPYAVSTAEKMYVANLVMITPDMDYSTKERYKNLNDIASYFISSIYHVASYQTSKELFEWNGHSRSKMLLFKGGDVDSQLLKKNSSLAKDIAHWLSERTTQ